MTKNRITGFFLIGASALVAASCANMGTPSGGPRDEDPPRLVSASPAMGATGVNRKRMTLTFDELVNVKDAFANVVVSPVSESVPKVSSLGRRVTVEFDSLAPNTTYTIDFGNAIEDNNEGNKLQNFAYTFSTGPDIDSLRISGRVLSARALEPQQGMIVGVHSNPSDTAFTGTRLLRVAKTDDRGRFTIRGLAPGQYRVFALGDNDNDYRYSSPEEDMAFYDFTVEPSAVRTVATDSVFDPLTGKLDSLVKRGRTQFLPNDIILRSFNSELRQQYMTKYERLDSTRVFLKFNTRAEALPAIRVLDRPEVTSLGTLEASERLDSLVWWLSPELMRVDSLRLEVTYPRSDQNLVVTETVDTLNFFVKRPKPSKKKEKKRIVSYKDSIAAITTVFSVKSGATQDVNLPVTLETQAPLARFDTAAVRLSMLVDTLYQPVAGAFRLTVPDSLKPRNFELEYPWEYGGKYRLEIDSLAGVDIYGKTTMPLQHDFTVKQTGDYCAIQFHITGLQGVPAFVELLNGSDAVQRTERVVNDAVYFPFLTPGRYYARIVLDLNDNGEYDTGNYALGLQPELAYYYPKVINIKKNWDRNEEWAVFDTPIDMMKPEAVLKNKPASDKRRRSKNTGSGTQEEEDEYFDPTRNPFDPNDKGQRRNRIGTGY